MIRTRTRETDLKIFVSQLPEAVKVSTKKYERMILKAVLNFFFCSISPLENQGNIDQLKLKELI